MLLVVNNNSNERKPSRDFWEFRGYVANLEIATWITGIDTTGIDTIDTITTGSSSLTMN